MPTGSFKDRGASVMLSLLRAQGVPAVLEDSCGNGGAAIAAYAAAGGMQARIMVPASTSPAKTVQSRAAGAEIELVPGSRQDCADAALRRGGEHLLRQPQLAPLLPPGHQDARLRAVGGPRLQGARQRHRPLRRGIERARLRHRLRRAAAGRADRPHAADLRAPSRRIARPSPGPSWTSTRIPAQPTIAEGTAIAEPLRLRECIGVFRQSQGGAVMLAEAEIAARHARPRPPRLLRRADLRPGGGGLRQAAGRRHHHAPRRPRWWC